MSKQIIEINNKDGSTTYRVGNREVTAWPLVQTFFDDKPCYMVRLVGDEDFYFGQGCIIFYRKEWDEGVLVWYLPDEGFKQYADKLTELGGWG